MSDPLEALIVSDEEAAEMRRRRELAEAFQAGYRAGVAAVLEANAGRPKRLSMPADVAGRHADWFFHRANMRAAEGDMRRAVELEQAAWDWVRVGSGDAGGET